MNKEDILIALKEIHARYCIPASEQNYTDKDYACMQYEKLVIHLSNQLDKYKIVLDKIKEYVKNNEKCIVECSGRDFMTGMPYEKIKTGLIEKTRIEKLLEEIE